MDLQPMLSDRVLSAEGSTLGFMLNCFSFEILNNFEQESLCFYSSLGLHEKYMAHVRCVKVFLRKLLQQSSRDV